jgi:AraC-like DNA-binding protein
LNTPWIILIILGTAQTFFLSLTLLIGKNVSATNKWLAAMLLALGANMLEYALMISGVALDYLFIIGLSYPLLFCIGPFYFIYVQSQFKKSFRFSAKQLLHFIVPVLCLLLMLPFYLTPSNEKLKFIESLEQNGTLQIPAGQFAFMIIHILQTAFYFFLAARFMQQSDDRFKEMHSNPVYAAKINYVKSFSKVFFAWLAIYLITTSLLFVSKKYPVEIDYVTMLTTSVLMFVFSYTVLKNPEVFNEFITEEIPIPEFIPVAEKTPEQETPTVKYRTSVLDQQKIAEIKQKLEQHFTTQKPYHNYDLKLQDVAANISVSSHHISQVINQEYRLNFFDFVNKFRVEEAKKLLESDQHDNQKMLAIAFDVGFNSKATFNRVFKKFTSLTPSEYRRNCLEKQG